MALICTLDLETPITVLHGNGEFIYRVAIGYDDTRDVTYSAMVIFSPLPGYGDGTGYELVFRLVESDPDGTHVHDYHDGLQTKEFLISVADRRATFDVICHLIAGHIDDLRPAAVEMTTHTAHLPEPALQKFHQIAAIFRDRGYVAGAADPFLGHMVWMMRLP